MTTQLLVRIAYPHVSRIETRVFTQSPVSIGSDPSNVLRLEHATVAGRQGEIKFTATSVHYSDCGPTSRTNVGGSLAQPGTSVSLESETLLQIGPYKLCAEVAAISSDRAGCPAGARVVRDDGLARTVFSMAGRNPSPGDTLTSFVYRALRLADVVSAVIVKLRAGCGAAGQRPFDTSPLHSSWNTYEIADYLLDTGASENRLTELESYLVELASRTQLPVTTGIGRA